MGFYVSIIANHGDSRQFIFAVFSFFTLEMVKTTIARSDMHTAAKIT